MKILLDGCFVLSRLILVWTCMPIGYAVPGSDPQQRDEAALQAPGGWAFHGLLHLPYGSRWLPQVRSAS